MQFAPLAYRIILGHFLPGFLALYPIALCNDFVHNFLTNVLSKEKTDIGTLLLIGISSIIIGNIIEAIRYSSFDIYLNRKFYGKNSASYSSEMKTEADIKFYELIYDTSYAPYQFYSNSAIVLLFTLIVWTFSEKIDFDWYYYVVLIIIILSLMISAVRATYGASVRILSRFKNK